MRFVNSLARTLVSGTVASMASTAALAIRGKKEKRSSLAPINAIRHWVRGKGTTRRRDVTLGHTLLGYGIHHASSILWATAYEKWLERQPHKLSSSKILLGAGATAGLACFIDRKLIPKRLKPDYEKHLSRRALVTTYSTFALGLAAPALLKRNLRRRRIK